MKNMNVFLPLLLAAGFASVQAQTIISVDLGAGTTVGGTATAGVQATDGWIQRNGFPNFTNQSTLFDDGSAAATTISGTGSGNISTIGAATTDGNYSMYNRGLGIQSGSLFSTITLNNLNTDFSQGYNVYVYFASASNSSGTSVVDTMSVSDGTTTFYFEADEDSASYQGTFLQATATSAGSSVVANYALFSGLSADTLTLSAQNIDTPTSSAAALTGIQIVAIPEPSSLLLVGVALLGLIPFLRRR